MPIYKIGGKKNKEGLQKYKVRINYVGDDGQKKQMSRIAYGSEDAKDMERRLAAAIKNKDKDLLIRKISVKDLFDEYIEVKQYEIRESTLDKYKRNLQCYILPTFEKTRIDKISMTMIRDWKLSIEKKNLSVTTKRNVFGDFRALLNYAVKMDYLPVNILLKAGNFRDNSAAVRPDMGFYTADEYKLFAKASKEIAMNKQVENNDLSEWDYYVFFSIAFYTGLRKGEIHALKWSDINGAYLSVRRSISQKLKGEDRETLPKNKSSIRTLQMPLPLIEILKEHKSRQGLLPRLNVDCRVCGIDKCLRDTTLEKRNKLYAEAAGIKKIRIHDFRHSHVSLLASEGINIQEIARRLGHSKIELTWNTYSHLYPHEEERAVSILNKVA